MDETPETDEGLEIPSTVKVFATPELADTICSFLDFKSLLTMRCVDRNWRELSYLSLNRRLRANIRNDPSNKEFLSFSARPLEQYKYQLTLDETSKRPLSSYSKLKLAINGVCLTQNLRPVLLPSPALLVSSVLRMDWLSSVSQLRLFDCLTVVEWNVAGIGIVKLFPFLKVLEVELRNIYHVYYEYENVISLCYAELAEAGSETEKEPWTSNLEYLSLRLHQDLLTADFPVTNISYDLISKSPKLTLFNANVSYGSLETGVACPSFSYTVNTSWDKQNDQNKPTTVKCSVCLVSPTLDNIAEQNSKAHQEAILQDLINAVNVIKPTILSMPNNMKFICSVDPVVRSNISRLIFEHQPLAKVIPTPYELQAFIKFPSFQNLRMLSWHCGEGVSDGILVERHWEPEFGALENLEVLMLIRSKPHPNLMAVESLDSETIVLDTWLLNNVCKLTPKLKMLIINFADTGEDRLRVLGLVAMLKTLKYLVLGDDRWFDNSGKYILDWTPAELACLHGGITSLSVIVKNWTPRHSVNYRQALIRICEVVETINIVGLFYKRCDDMVDSQETLRSSKSKFFTFVSAHVKSLSKAHQVSVVDRDEVERMGNYYLSLVVKM